MNQPALEYLVSHGKIGGVGRFRAQAPVALERGTRVVVESPRGVEVGAVLCPATPRHVRMLPASVLGRLLRPLDAADAGALQEMQARGQQLFDRARQLSRTLNLPLEVVDVELMLDGRQAIVQHLQAEPCDVTAFVEQLQHQHGLVVLLENLALPPEADQEHAGGCGDANCGRKDGGGCTTCSTGGGCSSCGSGKVDMAAYFSHLRAKMEQTHRVPLL